MALTGQAKKEYQREYMRRRRSNGNVVRPIARSNANVRPKALDPVRPDGCMEPETLAAIDAACGEPVRLPDSMLTPEPQSYNPMMVGYVPPKG